MPSRDGAVAHGGLVDCSAVIKGGQFQGRTLAQIAAALAEPYGVAVVAQAAGADALPSVQIQQGESVFELVERLARLQGLLVTDDAAGRLVLTRAGGARASGVLRQGDNVLTATGDLSFKDRYSHYVVKAQRYGDDLNFGAQAAAISAEARDTAVPRYRAKLIVAEGAADQAMSRRRILWEANRRAARGMTATVKVQGWHQPDGRLWQVNEIVAVDLPWCGIVSDLLIGELSFSLDEAGTTTTLHLATGGGAFVPEPVSAQSFGKWNLLEINQAKPGAAIAKE